jgi:cell division septation protein DedD
MPINPPSKESTQSGEVDFVLKHRIVGAGTLLFFGALVLPWLLGPPTEAVKLSNVLSTHAEQISGVIEQSDQQTVEQKKSIQEQEQIYISKITPLDGDIAAQTGNSANSAVKILSASDTMAGKSKSNDSQTTLQKAENSQGSSDQLKEGSLKSAEGSSKPSAVSKSAGSGIVKDASPVAAAPKVDVGWAVQVGVFTDKRGAAKVVDDLRGKGFNPSTSIVDTNRGKATATRIWLGPYAQRVDAAKAKSLLTNKTGEAGFIRAYP